MIKNSISAASYERPSVPLKVYVLPSEKELIQQRADECRMPISSYLKNLGLGFKPKSVADHQSILNLLKLNGDQGRLGGLLKLLLSEAGDHLNGKVHRGEINQLLSEMHEVQAQIVSAIKEVKEKIK